MFAYVKLTLVTFLALTGLTFSSDARSSDSFYETSLPDIGAVSIPLPSEETHPSHGGYPVRLRRAEECSHISMRDVLDWVICHRVALEVITYSDTSLNIGCPRQRYSSVVEFVAIVECSGGTVIIRDLK